MTEPHTTLTAAALAADTFAARHQAILASGREYAQSLRTRPRPPALADVITWLAQLTVEAHLNGTYSPSRRSLAAASAWTVDAVLSAEDPAHATTSRTAAAACARTRLANALADHPRHDRLGAMAARCARELALALDADSTPTARREALTAAHGELLALAVVRQQPLPWPPPVRPIRTPLAYTPPPAPWTRRGAAAHARRAAQPEQHDWALRGGRRAVTGSTPQAPHGDLAGIVAALPELTLDAIGLDIGGGRLAPRNERDWLTRAATRAAAALWRADHALPPELRAHPKTLTHARQRLGWIETARDHEDDPVLDGTHDLAQWLADAHRASTSNQAEHALLLAAGELLAVVLLAQAPQRAGWLAHARPRRGTRIQRRP